MISGRWPVKQYIVLFVIIKIQKMKRNTAIILTAILIVTFTHSYSQETQEKAPQQEQQGHQDQQIKKEKQETNTDNSQEKKSKTAEIEIQTSAVCGMCKERIEHDLAYAKGVKYVELDSETKVVMVEYNTSRTDPDKIRTAISEIGYDADGVQANQEAHDKLPACCQKGTKPH
jgi:mercuric ion binding protein